MLNIVGIVGTNISNMIKNIAQKVKNVFIMTFVMTDEEAQQMAKLRNEFGIFKNIILMELMDIPKNTTKILMIAMAIVTSLYNNGFELLTKRRELITWRRAVARTVAIKRDVTAVMWVNSLKASESRKSDIVEKIAEKIGIQIKPIYASSIDTLVSAAMVSNDALIKAITAAKESDDTLIDELIDALIDESLTPSDILYDLEWLVKITKMIEYKSDNSMIAVINAAASNYISDDDKNPDERVSIWYDKKQEIYKKAPIFIDTCPNNPFMPNALISIHREKWQQKIESNKTYCNEDIIRLKRMIERIEMEMTFARKSKAIIAFVIANRQAHSI
jgi:hypothetical protein